MTSNVEDKIKARAEELRKAGLSDNEIFRILRSEGFKPQDIYRFARISGKSLGRVEEGNPSPGYNPTPTEMVDREFVRKIETVRRDPKLPVIAREIDDYAWWRRVCTDLGIMVFFKLSPLANLTVEDREKAENALNKLLGVFNDMFSRASRVLEVEAENRRLKEELQQVKAELERWREYGREMEEWLDRFIEQARRYEVALSEWGE